jgi:hypothetical protein
VESACRIYRPRDPRKTALWGLLDTLHERVKGRWEERFERSYGFWRGLVDEAVARYLDCGIWDNGFARVRCRECPGEFLLALSCKGRGLCPSCGAKRAAESAAFLVDEVVEDVGHAQWVSTIPKMLRIYFLHHRELLGKLSQATAETAKGPPGGGGHGGQGLSARSGVGSLGFRGPSELPSSRARSDHARRLDGLRAVGPGAICGRAGGRGAVPPQGAGAASGPGAAETEADRASAVVEKKRLLRPQPGLRAPGGQPGLRGVGPVRDALAREPDEAALHPGRQSPTNGVCHSPTRRAASPRFLAAGGALPRWIVHAEGRSR